MCATDAAGDTEGMKMKINSKDFRVRPGEKVKLSKWPTIVKPFCKSKEQYQGLLAEHVEKLNSLQHLHYASNRYALLLSFQGMDAVGKDDAIRLTLPAFFGLGSATVVGSPAAPGYRELT
jgi:polyphosphate kinase 2 (PPK2 family)